MKSHLTARLLLAALVIGASSGVVSQSREMYTITDLRTAEGAAWSSVYDINASGQVVGYAWLGGHPTNFHAFLWQDGVMRDLGTLGGASSIASGINASGQVVGYSLAGNRVHAFLWQDGVMSDLGTLGGRTSSARGINDSGQVVGYADTSGDAQRAFLYQDGVMSDLGTLGGTYSVAFAINASGQVVGAAETTDGARHAFLYQDGVMSDLGTLGGGFSQALAINASGQVVGVADTTDGAVHAFLWQDGVMRDLGSFGGIDTVALDINASGQIVGGAYMHDGETRAGAWLWQNGVMTDLDTLLPPGSGWVLGEATAINDAGHIIGATAGWDPLPGAFLLTPAGIPGAPGPDPPPPTDAEVPEPATVYEIVARHSGKCIDVAKAPPDAGKVMQWDCHGGANQQWRIEAVGDGYSQLIAQHSGKCLDVDGWSVADGVQLQQWACNGGENQQWALQPLGDGYFALVGRHSGLAADVSGVSQENGAPIIQYSRHGGANQQWVLRSTGGPPLPSATNFDMSGVVTNEQGVPVAGAVVTMATTNPYPWPSTVSDASGGYRIGFSATLMRGGFVARAQVIAEGYELYWRSLFTNSFANNNSESFRLYPIKWVTAGDSSVVTFPADAGECTGWVARKCGIVRVTIPSTGTLTVEVTPTNPSAAQPTLEICCVSGNEIYGNPLTLSLDGVGGSELLVLIALRDDGTAAESFVVKTSFRSN